MTFVLCLCSNIKNNSVVVVGTGERCIPGDVDACGDGGQAINARLSYPKGLAISVDKTIYVSDSQNIRIVSPEGKIETLIGHHRHREGPPRPLACQSTLVASEVQLQWPTKLALNPLDSTLHIVDDTMILRLTPDLRVQAVAGVSPQCPPEKSSKSEKTADKHIFGPITDIAFAPNGQLYVTEKTPSLKSVVRVIDANGSLRKFAGNGNKSCHCTDVADCRTKCPGNILGSEINFGTLTSMAISPGGQVHVSDKDSLKILTVETKYPIGDKDTGLVQVADPEAGELYTFNRYGQHVTTHNMNTGSVSYSFSYSKNTDLGRLTGIQDDLGNKMALQRDYANRVQSIENTLGEKFSVKITRDGHLEKIILDMKNEIKLGYDEGDLLLSRVDSNGDFIVAEYNRHGKAAEYVDTSGHRIRISSDECPLPHPGSCLKIHQTRRETQKVEIFQNGDVVINYDRHYVNVTNNNEKYVLSSSKSDVSLSVTSEAPHPILKNGYLYDMQKVPSAQRFNGIGFSWSYKADDSFRLLSEGSTVHSTTSGDISKTLRVSHFNIIKIANPTKL